MRKHIFTNFPLRINIVKICLNEHTISPCGYGAYLIILFPFPFNSWYCFIGVNVRVRVNVLILVEPIA